MQNVKFNFAAATTHARSLTLPFLCPAILTHIVHPADGYLWVSIVGLVEIIMEGCLEPRNNAGRTTGLLIGYLAGTCRLFIMCGCSLAFCVGRARAEVASLWRHAAYVKKKK